MRVLDLFAGLCGWSAPFAERGHEVFSVDLDLRFQVDLHADILKLTHTDIPWRPDIILASPPCEGFTVMRIGRNWTGPKDYPPHKPKTQIAWTALKLVEATRRLIRELEPTFFVIENPVAKLRRLPIVADLERREVHYCHLGDTNMKPTDLWGGFPPSLMLPGLCHQRRANHEGIEACCCKDHAKAPRGSRTPGSVQGKNDSRERAEVPRALAIAVCLAAEHDLGQIAPTPTSQESLFAVGDLGDASEGETRATG